METTATLGQSTFGAVLSMLQRVLRGKTITIQYAATWDTHESCSMIDKSALHLNLDAASKHA